jgi:hypothetical protein
MKWRDERPVLKGQVDPGGVLADVIDRAFDGRFVVQVAEPAAFDPGRGNATGVALIVAKG